MLKRIAIRLVLTPAMIALTFGAAAPAADSDIGGIWRVSRYFCSDCGTRAFKEFGAAIQFTGQDITNPISDNCAAHPDYTLLREVSTKKLLTSEGKSWPTSFRRALVAHSKVRYGFITCGGINYMQLLVATPKRSFYFFEGGIVFELDRELNPGAGPAK